MWAFSKLERMPDDKTWAALETAAGRMAREMKPQDVANVMLAYATLGRVPNGMTRAALNTAAGRAARDMNSQAVANTCGHRRCFLLYEMSNILRATLPCGI